MSGEYYIIVHNNILLMGDEWMSIISLSATTSHEWVMSGEYYIIVHNYVYWMGD